MCVSVLLSVSVCQNCPFLTTNRSTYSTVSWDSGRRCSSGDRGILDLVMTSASRRIDDWDAANASNSSFHKSIHTSIQL